MSMASFRLQIVTPDGCFYDGEAEKLCLRSTMGEIGILANHIDIVTALGMGEARITQNGETKKAACMGGMLAVTGGEVKVVATTFEWAEQIDAKRAKASEARARAVLEDKSKSAKELKIAEARLKRALIRQSVAKG